MLSNTRCDTTKDYLPKEHLTNFIQKRKNTFTYGENALCRFEGTTIRILKRKHVFLYVFLCVKLQLYMYIKNTQQWLNIIMKMTRLSVGVAIKNASL